MFDNLEVCSPLKWFPVLDVLLLRGCSILDGSNSLEGAAVHADAKPALVPYAPRRSKHRVCSRPSPYDAKWEDPAYVEVSGSSESLSFWMFLAESKL